jgi:glycosyltransferase involved in cell wall biosynthesis
MTELRVCLLMESFYPIIGGGETHARSLAKGLTERGVPIVVVTLRIQPDLPAKEICDGYELYRVGSGRSRWKGMEPVYKKLQVLRDRYDVIYVSGFRTLGVPAVFVGHRQGKPVVLESLNNGELSGFYFDPGLKALGLSHVSLAFSAVNSLRRTVLRRADHFVAIAASVRREYVENGVPAKKVTLIPYGVDLNRFRPASAEDKKSLRRKLKLPQPARIVCFVGRLVSWKGPLTLLQAWRQVVKARSGGLDGIAGPELLVFLGAGGSDQRNCEAEARRFVMEAGLGESVRFEGDVCNVEDYLRAADIFAFPTRGDSFAIAVLEAMACGLPVVTTQIAGLADYVHHEINALAVEPGDVNQVQTALQRLLSDAELRARLGEAAAPTAQNYSQERSIERRLELFRKLASGKRSTGETLTTEVESESR